MRNPFRAGNYKSDSKSLGRSDTQNGVYYFHSALLGLSRFSSAASIDNNWLVRVSNRSFDDVTINDITNVVTLIRSRVNGISYSYGDDHFNQWL